MCGTRVVTKRCRHYSHALYLTTTSRELLGTRSHHHSPVRNSPFFRRTHLVKTALALVTSPAPHAGLERDAVADLDGSGRDLGAKLDDDAGRLVAETHGVLEHKRANARVLEVVHVRAADARLGNLDEDLVVAELGDGALTVSTSLQGWMQLARLRLSLGRGTARPDLATGQLETHLLELCVVDAVQDERRVVRLERGAGGAHFG